MRDPNLHDNMSPRPHALKGGKKGGGGEVAPPLRSFGCFYSEVAPSSVVKGGGGKASTS